MTTNPTAWVEHYLRTRELCGLRGAPIPSHEPRVPRDPNRGTPLETLAWCAVILKRARVELRGLEMACLEARYEVGGTQELSQPNEKARNWLWKHRPEFGAVSTRQVKENITRAEYRIGRELRKIPDSKRRQHGHERQTADES